MGLWDWVKSTTKNVVDTVMHPVLAVQEALGVAKAGENVGKSMESASRTAARSVDHATDKTTESLSQMTTTADRGFHAAAKSMTDVSENLKMGMENAASDVRKGIESHGYCIKQGLDDSSMRFQESATAFTDGIREESSLWRGQSKSWRQEVRNMPNRIGAQIRPFALGGCVIFTGYWISNLMIDIAKTRIQHTQMELEKINLFKQSYGVDMNDLSRKSQKRLYPYLSKDYQRIRSDILRKTITVDPSKYESWSSDELVDWIITVYSLRKLFSERNIDGSCLHSVTRADLRKWGIKLRHRGKFHSCIHDLINQQV
eukprot:211456_1